MLECNDPVPEPMRYNDPVLEPMRYNGWSVSEIGEASHESQPGSGRGTSIFARDSDLSNGSARSPLRSPTLRAHTVTPLPLDMYEWVLDEEDLALINELFQL